MTTAMTWPIGRAACLRLVSESTPEGAIRAPAPASWQRRASLSVHRNGIREEALRAPRALSRKKVLTYSLMYVTINFEQKCV